MRLRRILFGILISSSLGAALFLAAYGTAPLNPSNNVWLQRGDRVHPVLGWYFYRNEPWHFPLGLLNDYARPFQISIGFTDSIPLFAFIFKLFSPWLSETFQYFGLWLCLSF